ncbi:efflux RND transporter periplasmic adaptor subunit [Vibrio sp. FNV 38]|nr:efflux RND transporter periplasmic adaptor subunit [Vibrio sp. FNV 38]
MKKYLLLVGVTALAGFTAFSLHTSEQETPDTATTFTVDTTFSEQQILERSVHMLGNTFAHQSVEIKPEDKGKITKILVSSGQDVEQGQLLFLLDDRHQRAVVQRESANLKEIQRQYKNLLRLLPNGAVTQADVDSALAKVDMQQAELDIANANLEDKRVTAPFSGSLGLVDVNTGQNVDSESVLTTLDDSSQLRLNVAIPAMYLRQLQVGQSIQLTNIEGVAKVEAILSSLDGRVSNQTQNIQAQFLIDNKAAQLTPGSLVIGELSLPSQVEITVPLQSVVYRGHERFVYVIHDDKAEQRLVSLGERTGEKVQVLEGLKAGEEIVFRGTVKLRDGAEIKVMETVQLNHNEGDL